MKRGASFEAAMEALRSQLAELHATAADSLHESQTMFRCARFRSHTERWRVPVIRDHMDLACYHLHRALKESELGEDDKNDLSGA